jgi:plastocyanin
LRASITSRVAVATLLMSVVLPRAAAGTAEVDARDNFFVPQEIHVDVGGRVTWTNQGNRDHTVTSDEQGLFDSGRMVPGESFSRRFQREAFFYYFCRLHGQRGQVGMWGVVVVGNPGQDQRDKLVVPRDYATIQAAVDAAKPGAAIVVRPGRYDGGVEIATPDLVIRGVDRFRTIVGGGDSVPTGFKVTADDVVIKDLTVRNFTGAGIEIEGADGFTVNRVDLIKNRTYGVRAESSHDGVLKSSFAWGSGDSGFSVASCFGCAVVVHNVTARMNYVGVSLTNATGAVVRGSRLDGNGVGVLSYSDPAAASSPGRGALIYGNAIAGNNYSSVPAAGLSESTGLPFGTGVWLAGVRHNEVRANEISDHERYGVLVTQSFDNTLPAYNDRTVGNTVTASAVYTLAWDGVGESDCFSDNAVDGPTGPPDLQETYACPNRPFVGTPFAPVLDDVAAAIAAADGRPTEEPPEPDRPECQRGRPGCRR